MTTYATDGLYDWPVHRRQRWLAAFACAVGLVPAFLFVYVYLKREIAPLLVGHASADGLIWPSFTLAFALLGSAVIVIFVAGAWPSPATSAEVDGRGLTFRSRNGRAWAVRWDSPGFHLKLVKVPDGRYEPPHAQILS